MGKGIFILAMALCLSLPAGAGAALVARFDGSQVQGSSGTVARWVNQGGGGDAIASEAEGSRPTMAKVVFPNGEKGRALDFDGENDALEMESFPAGFDTNALTWFIVLNPDCNHLTQGILRSAYTNGFETSDAMWGSFMLKNGLLCSNTRNAVGKYIARSSAAQVDQWHLVVGAWGSNLLRQWVDSIYSGGTAKGADAQPAGHLRTRIGANSKRWATGFFDGQIAEIRIYNENMVGSENGKRKRIERELMDKYGIAITEPLDPRFEKSTLFKRPGKDDHYRVPRLVQLPSGDILACASLKLGNMRDAGGREERRYKISHDDGKTWSDVDGYKMATVVDGQTGKMWSMGHHWPKKDSAGEPMTEHWMIEHAKEALPLGAGVSISSSDASGINWISTDVTKKFYLYPGKGIANFIGHGIQLKRGKYAGRLIMPGRCYGNKWARVGSDARNVVVYSDDHGKIWHWGGMSQGYCGEGCIVELSDGSVYLNNRNHDPATAGHRSWSISRDGGKTFTEFGVADDLPSARCHASIARYSFPDKEGTVPQPSYKMLISGFCLAT